MQIRYFSLLFLLLSSITFAQSSFLDNIELLFGTTIIFVILMLAIAYMLSRLLSSIQLLSWVKTELRELIVAGLLFLIISIIFFSSNDVVSMLSGVPSSNVVTVTGSFFDKRIAALNSASLDLMEVFHKIGIRSGFAVSTAIPIIPYTYESGGGAPFSGYSSFFLFLSQASQALSTTLFAYMGLKIFMEFLLVVAPKLFFLAFIFRFIPFTRQIGNTLIALILGAAILLPFTVIVLDQFHGAITEPKPHLEGEVASRPPGQLPSDICESFVLRNLLANYGEIGFSLPPCLVAATIAAAASLGGGFAPVFEACYFEVMTPIVYPYAVMAYTLTYGSVLTAIAYEGSPNDIIETFDVLFPFLADIIKATVLGFVDVILVGIIVIVGVKSISGALGGEVFLTGLQRLL